MKSMRQNVPSDIITLLIEICSKAENHDLYMYGLEIALCM